MRIPVPRVVALAAAALAASGLAACGSSSSGSSSSGKPVYGGTLRLGANGDVDFLDPLSAYYTPTSQLERAYTRQLVTYPASDNYSKATSIVPDVATSVPTKANGGLSSDGLTYTFHLRPDVMWSTSPARAVTAQDFVREFKRFCNPVQGVGNPTYYTTTIAGMSSYCDAYGKLSPKSTAAQLAAFQNSHDISGITAPNATTLQIKLTQPANDFLNILAMNFVSAAPVEWDSYLPASPQLYQHLYSDGPYEVSSYTPSKKIVLTHNPAWKQSTDPDRHQYVKQIVVTEGISDPDAAQQDIQSGSEDLSWDQPVPTDKLQQLMTSKDPNFALFKGFIDNNYLAFNLRKGPASNLKVRQAVEYAINKVAVSKVYGGTAIAPPISTMIPQGSVGYQPFNLYATPSSQGSANQCKALLAQAGYSSSHPLTLIYAYRNGGNHISVYQAVSASLSACGIKVTGSPIQQGNYYAYVENPSNSAGGKWDITEAGWVPDWFGNNGRSTVEPLLTSPCVNPTTNYGCYNNATVNGDASKATAASDLSTAAGYWHQADLQALKDAVYVPMTNLNTALYKSTRVKNAIYDYTYLQYDVTQLWLSPSTP